MGLRYWETVSSSVELVAVCSLVSRRGVDGGHQRNLFGLTPGE